MMNNKNNFWAYVFAICLFLTLGLLVFFACTPIGRSSWYEYDYTMNKVDEQAYKKQKEVEDTCRSMIASYKSDRLIYEQYKTSSIQEEISWSNNARIRANQTANTYNEYILKNSFVWKNNVPLDIYMSLEII